MGQAPAGWYPQDDGRLRYWDGTAWTQRFAVKSAKKSDDVLGEQAPGVLWAAVGKPVTGFGGGRYLVTAQYLFVERGRVSTDARQVRLTSVVDVDVRQSAVQKVRGVGDLVVRFRGQHGLEKIVLEDVTDFRQGQRVINDAAHEARLDLQRRANTHHTDNVVRLIGPDDEVPPLGVPTPPGQRRPPSPSGADTSDGDGPDQIIDLTERLRRLAEAHEAGVITHEEYVVKKADILRRW